MRRHCQYPFVGILFRMILVYDGGSTGEYHGTFIFKNICSFNFRGRTINMYIGYIVNIPKEIYTT